MKKQTAVKLRNEFIAKIRDVLESFEDKEDKSSEYKSMENSDFIASEIADHIIRLGYTIFDDKKKINMEKIKRDKYLK